MDKIRRDGARAAAVHFYTMKQRSNNRLAGIAGAHAAAEGSRAIEDLFATIAGRGERVYMSMDDVMHAACVANLVADSWSEKDQMHGPFEESQIHARQRCSAVANTRYSNF